MCPLPEQWPIRRILHHLPLAGGGRIRTDAFAVDVDHKRIEAEFPEHLGALVRVLADARPLWKHQDAWPLRAGRAPNGKPLTRMAIVVVFDDIRLLHVPLPATSNL